MASINGITVKALKTFRGHEGEPCCQGNLYIGTKKIGFWSQDSWGGCDNFMLDRPYSEMILERKVRDLNANKARTVTTYDGTKHTIEYGLESLMSDLIALLEDEKIYKKAIKDGFKGVILVSDGYHMFGWKLNDNIAKLPIEQIISLYADEIEKGKVKHKFFKADEIYQHRVKIYRSTADFNIGTKIKIDEIIANK